MDSANKAILMAFGMLVGIMIIGMVTFLFTHLKVFPESDDVAEDIDQVSAFNKEYEIYDKKIMYGVDVVSVLNKAKNNNEKYVAGKFLSGDGYNSDYLIDIQVVLKNDITERLDIKYFKFDTMSHQYKETSYNTGEGPRDGANDVRIRDTDFKNLKPSEQYCEMVYGNVNYWNENNSFKCNTSIETTLKKSNGTFHLLPLPGLTNGMDETGNLDNVDDYSGVDTSNISNLSNTAINKFLTQSDVMKQTFRNRSSIVPTTEPGWTQATWTPAVYEFKTRKFRSDSDAIIYNSKTKRIIRMRFEEI